jgi:hypothetical protein
VAVCVSEFGDWLLFDYWCLVLEIFLLITWMAVALTEAMTTFPSPSDKLSMEWWVT